MPAVVQTFAECLCYHVKNHFGIFKETNPMSAPQPQQDIRITAKVFRDCSNSVQNAVISAIMTYIVDNDVPYRDGELFQCALEMIESDNFPVQLKMEFVNTD